MKTKIIILTVLVLLTLFVLKNVSFSAPECFDGYILDESGVCFPDPDVIGLSDKSFYDILVNFMYWILGVLGILAILAFIISGIQYLVSAGDEKIIETAKRNIKWSIVGLAVALASLSIVKAIDFILIS